jgi:ubiquinone/menaquinone biosynthesis C-methylase UbiE
MIESNDTIEYIGDELNLFKNATNWKYYFSSKIASYIKGDVLEVGAGTGINTFYLSNKNRSISSWTLLEPDTQLFNLIDENVKKDALLNLSKVNGTIKSVSDKLYDTIIYIDVLEHIEDSKGEIIQAKKQLKSGGHLIILVPAYNYLYNSFDKRIGHFRRYDKRMLTNEIDNQLVKIELFYLDSLGYFASMANKLFLKKELPSLANINFWDKILIPLSKISDFIFLKAFGKSLIGIYKKN